MSETWWCIRDGDVLNPMLCARTRKAAICLYFAWCQNDGHVLSEYESGQWTSARAAGYRAVKIRVEEIS